MTNKTNARPRIAVIGAGGTISTRSDLGSLDFVNYMASGTTLEVGDVVRAIPEASNYADLIPISFGAASSTAMAYEGWRRLKHLIDATSASLPAVDGIVILHGTATMEETAYFLQLSLNNRQPVVITGSQRPLGALSSDAPLNFINAIRVAGSPGAQHAGVLVTLNDEIHAAREVRKASTSRLNAFVSPDFGIVGEVNADGVNFYRKAARPGGFASRFDFGALDTLPRVDIAYSYAGDDGAVLRALASCRAKGIVIAAFPGGRLSPLQKSACLDVMSNGVTIVISTRAGSGRAHLAHDLLDAGMVSADNLTPQKARILLSLMLATTSRKDEIQRAFDEY